MENQQSRLDGEDELLTVLADHNRREILSYFRETSEEVASLDELAREVDDGGEERTALTLHHSTLPRLAEIGVVDYDARSRTVRYRGHAKLEALFDAVPSGDLRSY